MFYDHRILTERKYGIATIWLVATLGNKTSVSKKVQKREILDVDLNKACDTILNPEAPLALRLQSNLLYGVSRVFKEQYHYFYADVNTAHTKLSKEVLTMSLEKINLGKERIRPENLLLPDDPAFVPGLALLTNTQELDELFGVGVGDTSTSTLGDSPGPSTPLSKISGKYQLDPASSSISGGGGFDFAAFGGDDDSLHGSGLGLEIELPGYVDFEFDEDGNLREIEPIKRGGSNRRSQRDDDGGDDEGARRPRARRASSADFAIDDDLAQQMVVDDHDGALKAIGDLDNNLEFDIPHVDIPNFDVPNPDDAAYRLPQDASPLPERQLQVFADQDDIPMILDEPDEAPPQQPERRRRRPPPKKKTAFDEVTMIPQKKLAEWQMNYLEIMAAEINRREQSRKNREAKIDGRSYVFEINGLPKRLHGLNEMLNGFLLKKHAPKEKDGADEVPVEEADVPVDMQMVDYIPQPYMGDDEEIGLNAGDELPPIIQESPGTEVGRQGSVPLPGSAAVMPWNMSAQNSRAGSVFSAGGGGPTSSSVGGNLLSSNRRAFSRPPLGRSRVSASPLLGRGTKQLPGDEGEDTLMEGWDVKLSSPRAEDDLEGLDNFEYYGPAAEVETQLAQGTQWVMGALEAEGANFLAYLRIQIEKLQAGEEDDDDELRGEDEANEITFGRLVDPSENTYVVAAQAFHHTLSLATKGFLRVSQEHAYGNINIQVLSSL